MKRNYLKLFLLTLIVLIPTFIIISVNNKKVTINNVNAIHLGRSSNKIGAALTQSEFDEKFKETATPSYSELEKLANELYGMGSDVFKVVFGWEAGEAYNQLPNSTGKVDHYLGYLCGSIGVNYYMGYNLKTAESLARKLQGDGPSSKYSVSAMNAKAQKAINDPVGYAPSYKAMYLILKYPDENAHGCDGLSYYEDGSVYYAGGYYNGYQTKVWSLWYTGITHWKSEANPNVGDGIGGSINEQGTFTPNASDPRLNYDDPCIENETGIRETIIVIGKLLSTASYAIPIIIIVLGMVDFVKALISNDEKTLNKATSSLIKRVIAGLVVMAIPHLLLGIMDGIGLTDKTSESYSHCLNCLLRPYDSTNTTIGTTEK